MQTIDVYVERIIYRNEANGYCVLMTNYDEEELIVVGSFQVDVTGQMLRVTGEMDYHPSYGEQMKVQQYEILEPTDEQSIRRYLSSGAVKGVGEALAARIVKRFGEDTLRIMEEEPERLAEIKGISLRKAQDIAVTVAEKKDLRAAMLFLQKYGIGNTLAVKIYETYGLGMYGILKENPYKMAEDIEGVGFKTADAIAEKIGIHTNSDYRIRSGILYVLSQALAEGNMYLPVQQLLLHAEELLGVECSAIEPHIMNLAMDKKLVCKGDCVYSMSAYYAESNVAGLLLQLRELPRKEESEEQIDRKISEIEKEEGILLDELQKEAVKGSIRNGVFLLTGGPGTGKTTTINTMIRYFMKQGYDIALAAPTGRAAKRMTEATGYEARTIHRLLEVSGGADAQRGYFERDEHNPLELDAIIIDEMSMVDIFLFQSLLKAVPVGTRLILVGDMHQLPSVGPGQVLRDIAESGEFACVKLEKIFRQEDGSDIVINAHKIKAGQKISLANQSKDFFFLPRDDAKRIYNNIVQLVTDKMPRYTNAQPYDIQVLTPMKKGALGAVTLNKILQEYVNPQDSRKKEYVFGEKLLREGDKVMQVKNNYKLEWEIVGKYNITIDKGLGVFNGDVGKIISINEYARQIKVEYDEGRFVLYSFDNVEEIELAYAMTIHKAQGSEYPAVIIPLLGVPKLLLYRNLLYTAVTRAVKCVTIIGTEETVEEMIVNENVQMRYTGLKQKIKEQSELV
ncbi:MAG: ATP-dependent RecD-like DNA helicase [Lachnospiraceae bacterium]|nr:ATP-dependent RecD-like DNA helicase [Lachnospiraceae bacterium]